jgi:hypothetical protein
VISAGGVPALADASAASSALVLAGSAPVLASSALARDGVLDICFDAEPILIPSDAVMNWRKSVIPPMVVPPAGLSTMAQGMDSNYGVFTNAVEEIFGSFMENTVKDVLNGTVVKPLTLQGVAEVMAYSTAAMSRQNAVGQACLTASFMSLADVLEANHKETGEQITKIDAKVDTLAQKLDMVLKGQSVARDDLVLIGHAAHSRLRALELAQDLARKGRTVFAWQLMNAKFPIIKAQKYTGSSGSYGFVVRGKRTVRVTRSELISHEDYNALGALHAEENPESFELRPYPEALELFDQTAEMLALEPEQPHHRQPDYQPRQHRQPRQSGGARGGGGGGGGGGKGGDQARDAKLASLMQSNNDLRANADRLKEETKAAKAKAADAAKAAASE